MNFLFVPILFFILSLIEANTTPRPVKIPKNWVMKTDQECLLDGLDGLDYITAVQLDIERLRKKPKYIYKRTEK